VDSVIRTTILTRPRIIRAWPSWLGYTANGFVLVVLLSLVFTVRSGPTAMRLGEVAGETVVAQRQATYVDHAATAAKMKRAMDSVPAVYRFNPGGAHLHTLEATSFLPRVTAVLAAPATTLEKQAAIARLVPADLSASAMEQFPIMSTEEFRLVSQRALALLMQAEAWRFTSDDLNPTELGLLSTVTPTISRAQRLAISDLLVTFVTPTMLLDQAATGNARRAAATKVKPVQVTIYPGEVVVRRGDVVTQSDMERLAALGLQNRQLSWHEILGSVLYVTVIVAMLFWYLRAFHGEILANGRLLLLVDGCVLAVVTAARLFATGHVLLPFFLPVAAASTFAGVLVAPEACIALALAMAVLAGWVVSNSFELTIYYFITGTAGVLAIRQVRQIKQFIVAGLVISVFALATILAFGVVDRGYDLSALQEYVLASGFNGFLSSTLALGGFALLSSFFGVTTTLQLLELVQPNQPLMRRLMVRAPGTYNHSLVVASMVERAADEISANALSAKVGALYHDVGKTANPHCFVENQMGMTNVHEVLRSDESARIIRGHVTHGLRLSQQHKLPRPVRDAIAEHHGTLALAFFLNKALQETDGMPVDGSLYTYPGPKPQSKETALIMLADACEPAVRAAPDHSHERIREIVEKLFQERVQQDQLDECPLTLRDLERTKEAFRSVLNGLYHPRIEYPEVADVIEPKPAPSHAQAGG
jgi:putative nucleotidyltransferase with HDIG domain